MATHRIALATFLIAAAVGCSSVEPSTDAQGESDFTKGATSTDFRFACDGPKTADPVTFNLYYSGSAPDQIQIKAFWGFEEQVDVLGERQADGRFAPFKAIDPLQSKPGAPVFVAPPVGNGAGLIGSQLELDEHELFVDGPSFEGAPDDGPHGRVVLTAAKQATEYTCTLTSRGSER
jgi:hypothetical protein